VNASGWIRSIGAHLNISQQGQANVRKAIRAVKPVPAVKLETHTHRTRQIAAGNGRIMQVSSGGSFSVKNDGQRASDQWQPITGVPDKSVFRQ